jgi:hypothetical protein
MGLFGLPGQARGGQERSPASGPKKTELDIFDLEGRYLYAVVVSPDLRTDDLQFFASGFGTIEQDGDYTVYREYRIKNLPDIFGK